MSVTEQSNAVLPFGADRKVNKDRLWRLESKKTSVTC